MIQPIPGAELWILNPVTGKWDPVAPVRSDVAWDSSELSVHAAALYNPKTGASTGLMQICEGTFQLSAKQLHWLSRPRGMSLAHWRKVRRERRLDQAVDIRSEDAT